MQAGTYFPKVRRMLLFHAPLILAHFWPASTLLREHLALATLSPPETDPQIWSVGATLMRFTWTNVADRGILVSNLSMTRNSLFELHTLDWLYMSVHFRRIDFGGIMSWKTQPNCRASKNWRLDEFCPNFLSLFLTGFPVRSWQASETDSLSCQFPFFNIATALLSSFFLDLFVGCSSTWRCAYEHFPNLQPLLVL